MTLLYLIMRTFLVAPQVTRSVKDVIFLKGKQGKEMKVDEKMPL